MESIMVVRNYDELTLSDLYDRYEGAIELAVSTKWAWAGRTRNTCAECIEMFQRFRRGEVTTDDVKAKFRLLTVVVGNEVILNDVETYAIYCLAGVAHAAAHLGHLATAMSRIGEANQKYAAFQKGYVMLGIEEAHMFAALVNQSQPAEVA